MDEMDLSLIPLDDLLDEVFKRHDVYVVSLQKTDEGVGEPQLDTYWKDGKFIDCLGMCSALEDDLKRHYRAKEN